MAFCNILMMKGCCLQKQVLSYSAIIAVSFQATLCSHLSMISVGFNALAISQSRPCLLLIQQLLFDLRKNKNNYLSLSHRHLLLGLLRQLANWYPCFCPNYTLSYEITLIPKHMSAQVTHPFTPPMTSSPNWKKSPCSCNDSKDPMGGILKLCCALEPSGSIVEPTDPFLVCF